MYCLILKRVLAIIKFLLIQDCLTLHVKAQRLEMLKNDLGGDKYETPGHSFRKLKGHCEQRTRAVRGFLKV